MAKKPTFEELEQRVKELEKESVKVKQAEKALKQSEEKFSKAFHSNASIMALSTLEDGRFIDINEKFLHTFSFERDEVIGKTSAELQLFGDMKQRDVIKQIVNERGYIHNFEITFRTKKGELRNGFFSGDIINLSNQACWLTVVHDITNRKRAEEELRKSEERLRSLFNDALDMIHILDEDGKIVYANPAELESMAYTRDEYIGKHILEIVHPDYQSTSKAAIDSEFEGKEVKGLETAWITKHGKRLDVEVNAVPQTAIGKVVSIRAITRNITESKRADEERAKLHDQLLQAQKMESIGTLAGGIAHDFNNILFPIIGYADMTMYDLPEDSNSRRNLEEILKASKRAKELVQQILTFSRRHDQEQIPLKIQTIIKEVIKFLRSTIPTSINIIQNIDNDCKAVKANPTQIHQVLMNLFTNAYHATEDKGGTIEVTLSNVRLDAEFMAPYPGLNPGSYAKLTVSDTGCGMEKDVKERIFEPYFTTKEVDKGTGMGLSVVHGIITTHGGHITVYSEPGKGTTFHVYLPHIETTAMEPETVSTEPVEIGNEHILLVDDEEINIRMMQQMLETLGYQVIARTSSLEALEAFRAQPDKFDLVLTDTAMPNMTGDQLAKKLLNIKPGIPIILLSGFSEVMSEEKARSIGIRKYLMKPVARRNLANTIRKVLDQE